MPTDTPKELFRLLSKSDSGYCEFDTAEAGPFRLPVMDRVESVDLILDQGIVELRLRDQREEKLFRIPLMPQTAKELVSALEVACKHRSIEWFS